MLLPPDLRDWVPQRHMVHFIIEAIEHLDLNCFRVNWRGCGSEHSAVSYKRAGEMIELLQTEVETLVKKAEDADSTPLDDGLSIPEEIARREDRIAKLAYNMRRMFNLVGEKSLPEAGWLHNYGY